MPGSQVPEEVRVFVLVVSIFVVSFIDEYCKVDELCPGCVVSCKCLVAASGLKIGDTWNSECRLVHRAAANALSWLALLALPCLALPFVKIGDTWNSECGLVHKAAANALSWLAFCLALPFALPCLLPCLALPFLVSYVSNCFLNHAVFRLARHLSYRVPPTPLLALYIIRSRCSTTWTCRMTR